MVGISLPLTGQFPADGQATKHGYELWASDVNAQRRPARPPGQAEDPERQEQPDNVTQGLQDADPAGPRGPDAGAVLHPAHRPPRRRSTKNSVTRWPAASATGPLVYALNDPYLFSVSAPVKRADGAVRQLGAVAARPRAAQDGRLPDGERPVRRPAGADRPDDPAARRDQDGLLHNPSTRPATATDAPDQIANAVAATPGRRGARLGGRAQPARPSCTRSRRDTTRRRSSSRRPARTRAQAFLNTLGPGTRRGDDGAGRLVRRGAERAQPRHGAGLHRQVRRHRLRHQRGRGRGLLRGRGAGRRGHRDAAASSNSVHRQYLHTHTVQTAEGPAKFNQRRREHRRSTQAFIFQWQNGQFVQVLPNGRRSSASDRGGQAALVDG